MSKALRLSLRSWKDHPKTDSAKFSDSVDRAERSEQKKQS